MYSASWLLRFEPATWGSCVKIRCCRRASSALGMDLNLDSISASRAADLAVKPEIDCAFAFERRKRASVAPRSRVIAVRLYRRRGSQAPHPPAQLRGQGGAPRYFDFRISVSRSGLDSSRTR